MTTVTIIDYGLGNIRAFSTVYEKLGVSVKIAGAAAHLEGAERLILPGVGAFDWAMTRLEQSGMRAPLDQLVLKERVPVLGICVGMQMMGRSSEEGVSSGLGWLDAEVLKFPEGVAGHPDSTPLPHMGWNVVAPVAEGELFRGLPDPSFYFLHSYYIDAHSSLSIARSHYGIEFTCAVARDNVFGVQFHPEKSHHYGVRLLENFVNMSLC